MLNNFLVPPASNACQKHSIFGSFSAVISWPQFSCGIRPLVIACLAQGVLITGGGVEGVPATSFLTSHFSRRDCGTRLQTRSLVHMGKKKWRAGEQPIGLATGPANV
jgi:hypothetical protein